MAMSGNSDSENKPKRELSEAELQQRREAAAKGGAAKKTMTDAALQQRREAAALSTGPVTEEGKAASSRNNWRTGEYSAITKLDTWERMMLSAVGKPCKSTCAKYPCSLVDDGATRPGGNCMDKEVFVQAFDSIMATLATGDVQHMHGMLAGTMAQAIDLVQQLRQHIAEDGALILKPFVDKEGNVVKDEGKMVGTWVLNPVIPQLSKLLDVLGFSLPEMMATPKAIMTQKNKEDETDALADMFSDLANVARGIRESRRGRVIEGETE